ASFLRLRSNSTITLMATPSHNTATATPTFYYHPSSVASTSFQLTPTSAIPTHNPNALSPSAAMGIGVAAGVCGIIILLTAILFIYRCWKVRQSPPVRYYEQARLWKGFTPVTPSTARTTLVESKMANIYFTELRSP
ncbi:hypothetical protein CC86DRAFT_239717, partial [Ophiobolus disseminans]